MDKYEIKSIKDKKVWEKFVLSGNPRTFLQSWNWGETESAMGKKIFRLAIISKGKIAGVCLVIKESAKRGAHLIIPAGPLLDWENKSLVSFFMKEIISLAKVENVWFIRLRPEHLDTPDARTKFRKLGFVDSPMHVHAENTWILDIRKNDGDLLSGMRKSTRYLIRKSLNSNLKVEISRDKKYAKLLFELQEETAKRHGFIGFPEKLFKSEIESFSEDNQADFFICRLDGKPLAVAIIIFYGNSAYYHYSGSVTGNDKIPFSYFLQWKIIKEAQRRGMSYYNFWGISPENKPDHRFAGVTLFKTGFGGERYDWLHAQDFPISPFYKITYLFETLRRFQRRL